MAPRRTFPLGGWTVHEFGEVDSTNAVAAALPPWAAVRADRQARGRGRFQRPWVSDEGGLWCSLVVPAISGGVDISLLPLVAGLALARLLKDLPVAGLRLRWPNDVMVGSQKLAGFLVERFCPETAVIGLGLNVRNQPEAVQPDLRGQVTRLADWLPSAPAPNDLLGGVLEQVAGAMDEWRRSGFGAVQESLKPFWQAPRPVRLDLDGGWRTGVFDGIDAAGRLLFRDAAGQAQAFAPHEVRQLIEL
jgi:BirA family biotin operon repressor/biotin-[acetyl-CoA-carboxylase] ligase